MVTGSFSDGNNAMIAYTEITMAPAVGTRYTLDTATGLLTTLAAMAPPAAGTEQITISHNTITVPDTTVDVTVGTSVVTSLQITPSVLTGQPNPADGTGAQVPGQMTTFVVEAIIDGNTGAPVDVSSLPSLEVAAIQGRHDGCR